MPWTQPIYDRTNDDVQDAKAQIAAWLADPDAAVVTDLKGCLNPADMNRIEGNMQYLEEQLVGIGFRPDVATFKTDWAYTDYSTLTTGWRAANIGRILGNLSALVDVLPPAYATRPVPDDMVHYPQINDIEYIQEKILSFVTDTIDSYRYSGAVISGDIWAA
jgi:hypothetical protein